ncbi:MAG: VWA domain-containing protein [Meiothermus sp.]|uniref:vWA domain-containing protein n=1 Tax=Meiothermus sp. TaxID=1955249 RepID=UPI0025DD00B0|nr:VWA domain-containing protein [Meiothermus sp.]MCS7068080.1 VWA domain-containing protein [Meiothermus sp.]MCX7601137.1 VWA domain-containing protein [Meiothermus sp.]MDW8426342.1 VWA domain-containing protein [Meiothermus sp.]
MVFIWPWALILLLLVPGLVWLYLRGLRPPAESGVLHPDAALLARASRPAQSGLHLPAGLYLLALVAAIVALARPTLPVLQADPRAAVVLTVDISRSMQATDILPSRFEAARAALRTFIRELPEGLQVALVTFSRDAQLVVPLTTDRGRLLEAVDFLDLNLGTAIGDAILESIAALPPLSERAEALDPKSLATIILLTDGRSLAGVDPVEAAREAARLQIRVHAIGIGRTSDGPVPGLPEQYALAAQFDEETLKEIARVGDGQYFFVDSAGKLKEAYRTLTRQMQWRIRRDEATAYLALLAGALLLLSLGVAQLRRQVV